MFSLSCIHHNYSVRFCALGVDKCKFDRFSELFNVDWWGFVSFELRIGSANKFDSSSQDIISIIYLLISNWSNFKFRCGGLSGFDCGFVDDLDGVCFLVDDCDKLGVGLLCFNYYLWFHNIIIFLLSTWNNLGCFKFRGLLYDCFEDFLCYFISFDNFSVSCSGCFYSSCFVNCYFGLWRLFRLFLNWCFNWFDRLLFNDFWLFSLFVNSNFDNLLTFFSINCNLIEFNSWSWF